MRSLGTLVTALSILSAISTGVFAEEYTAGEIMKVDVGQKKLTIKHGELKNLEMPPMTMVFVVAEDSMIEEVKVGQKIEFTADRVNGRITVTEIK